MKRKLRYDRLIILIVIVLLIVCACIAGYKAFFVNEEVDDPSNPNVEVKGLKLDLMDYAVYQNDVFNFDFAVLKIRLQDEKAIDFSLDRLQKEDEEKLSNYADYTKQLEKEGYYLSTIPVDFTLKSDENSAMFNIFVPYEKGLEELTIYNLDDGTFFKVDLEKNLIGLDTLYQHTGGNISDGKTYEINVSDPSSTQSIYRDGQEYSVASTLQIFSFKLVINELSELGISIDEAVFVPNGSDTEYEALDASYSTMKLDNVLGKPLNIQDVYGVFFEIYAPYESGITYEGILKLKFSNNEEWVEIHTTLE